MTWRNWIAMGKEAIRAILMPVGMARYRQRLEVCSRCIVYDPALKRCRPYDGAPVGCGCYVPYKAMGKGPCWLRARNPELGWD